MTPEDFKLDPNRQLYLSDLRDMLAKVASVIGRISEQSASELQPHLNAAQSNINESTSIINDLIEIDYNVQVWIDKDGLLRVGGSEPTKLLDSADFACIKALGIVKP